MMRLVQFKIGSITHLSQTGIGNFQFICNKLIQNRNKLCNFKRTISATRFTLNKSYKNTKTSLLLEENALHVIKNVTLYANENIIFYRYLHFFCISQFIFWTYLSYVSYATMKNTPVPSEDYKKAKESANTGSPTFVPIWRQLNLGQYKNYISAFCGIVGCLSLVITSLYTRHSIRTLVLKKGGDKAIIEFFSLFKKGRCKTIPLSNISAKNSRQNARSYLALKIKGEKLFLILDMKGKFLNERLFDQTVGLRRPWAK